MEKKKTIYISPYELDGRIRFGRLCPWGCSTFWPCL